MEAELLAGAIQAADEEEAALQMGVEVLHAIIRDLTQLLYGAKSEKSVCPDCAREPKPTRLRKRGQQPGSPGYGRSDRATLPMVTEMHDLSEAAKRCPVCGSAFVSFPGAEESTLIGIQVQTHMRRMQCQRYHKACQCPQVPSIGTVPPAPWLGVSVWTQVLLNKYLCGRPPYRCCEGLRHPGLPLS